MNSSIHIGEMIEEIIRVNQLSISEVARKMHVNRRSVYNWFKQKSIRPYILHRICNVLAVDFSIELPSTIKDVQAKNKEPDDFQPPEKESDSNSVNYWMNKYIYLLEKYNEILSQDGPKDDPSHRTPKGSYRYMH